MIKIVIATQQPIFRAGLAKRIAIEDDLRIVAQPLSVAHLGNALASLRPHLALLSSDFFPATDDFASVIRFTSAVACRALVLTKRPEQAFKLAALGVRGVLSRKIHGDALIAGIRRVARGEMCLPTDAPLELPLDSDPPGEPATSSLSGDERRIITAMLRGLNNGDMAEQLGIALPLLKKRIGFIYDKAGVCGRLELALFMVQRQVIAMGRPKTGSPG